MSNFLLSPQYRNEIYIPSALLLLGVYIVKSEWMPYAIGVAIALSSYKIYSSAPTKVLNPNKFQYFELKEKTPLSDNTAIYRFALPRPNDILGLPIGQHITIAATIDNKEVARSYTPVSADHNTGYFDLLIKSYPQGNISKHVGEMKIGQKLKVKGPKGAMIYKPNMARHIGMIAGGTGITPMLQIIRAISRGRDAGDKTEVDFIFANVKKKDILLKEDLDRLAQEDPLFRVHYVLNDPPVGWTGGVGFVSEDLIRKYFPSPAKDVKILLCGPPPMISAMKKHCSAVGFEGGKFPSKLEDQVFCF